MEKILPWLWCVLLPLAVYGLAYWGWEALLGGVLLIVWGIQFVGLIRPLPALGLPNRIVAVVSLVAVFIAFSVGNSDGDEQRLSDLKATNPSEYLVELKKKSESRWLQELKTMKPEQFDDEIERREKSARAIPASKLYENLQAYRVLHDAVPENAFYSAKVEEYQSKIERRNEEQEAKESAQAEFSKTASIMAANAQVLVQRRLKDPDSAKFGRIFVVKGEDATVACGYVNARNGFGGYTGETKFISNGMNLTFFESDMDYNEFTKVWNSMCVGGTSIRIR